MHVIKLDGYNATVDNGEKLELGTFDSYGEEQLQIVKAPDWGNLSVIATFNPPYKKPVQAVVDSVTGVIKVPKEATADSYGVGTIVFVGLADGVQRISSDVEYIVRRHSNASGTEPAEPTPDLLQQVLTLSKDAQTAAKNAEQSAKNAAKDAADTVKPYKEEAVQAATAASLSEKSAAESKAAAQKAAERATQAGIAASNAAEEAERSAGIATDAAGGSALNAENARKSALNAQQSANNAAESQSAAAANADAAAKSQQSAAIDAKTASDAKVAAAGSAEAAAGSANAAENSASAAAGSEQAAGTSELKAAKSEKAAKASEQAAAESVQAALESKTAAATSETNAAASAKKAQDVADSLPADYTTAVNEIAALKTNKADKTELDTVKQQVENITPDDSSIGEKPWSSKHIIDMLCPEIKESGNPVVCYPVAGYALGVKAKWEPAQEGSGTPSPENIRPIKGRDSVKVERCGENLSTTAGLDGVGWAAIYEELLNVLNKLPAGTYVLDFTFTLKKFFDRYTSDTAKSNAFRINSQFDDGTPCIVTEGETITKAEKLPSVRKITETFVITPQHKGRVATAYFYACGRGDAIEGAPNGALGEGDISNVTITLGNTAPTTYTPFIGQTNTLTLPETVYGGEVDAVTGEGQETWEIIDLAKANISLSGINQHGIANFSLATNLNNIHTTPGTADYFTSSLPKDTAMFNNATKIGIFKANASTFYIRLKETDANNEGMAKAYLASINAKLVYKLAAPVPFTATGAQPLPALKGTNTVLTDADSATVTGRADPIKRITDLEDAVASQT